MAAQYSQQNTTIEIFIAEFKQLKPTDPGYEVQSFQLARRITNLAIQWDKIGNTSLKIINSIKESLIERRT
jgi:hypothetical protein